MYTRSFACDMLPLVQFSPKRSAGQTQSRDPTPLKQISPPVHGLLMMHWSTTEMDKKPKFHDYLAIIMIYLYINAVLQLVVFRTFHE